MKLAVRLPAGTGTFKVGGVVAGTLKDMLLGGNRFAVPLISTRRPVGVGEAGELVTIKSSVFKPLIKVTLLALLMEKGVNEVNPPVVETLAVVTPLLSTGTPFS